MTEHVVLDPAADLIEAAVPDPNDVERVSSPDTFEHVDHGVGLEIDQTGHIGDVAVAFRREERSLVDPELFNPPDPGRVINQSSAVLDHRVHDRPPTHPELRGNLRHWPGQLADLAARLNPGAPRDQLPCQDRRVGLSPGLNSALNLAAPPPSFHPNNADWTTKTRRRWVTGAGGRHHLLDPTTGNPSDTTVAVAIVAGPAAWQADVVAKAALIAGINRGRGLITETGSTGLLIALDGQSRDVGLLQAVAHS